MTARSIRLVVVSGAALSLSVSAILIGLVFGSPSAPPNATEVFDCGRIAIDSGPALATHKFEITNKSNRTRFIVDVVPTCACLAADPSTRELAPGEVATLVLAMGIKASGRTGAAATLVYADGSSQRYAIEATGVISRELTAIRQPGSDADVQKLKLLLVDYEGKLATRPPQVTQPPGAVLTAEEWVTIEEPSQETGRPIRQTCLVTLKIPDSAQRPLEVRIETEYGAATTIDL